MRDLSLIFKQAEKLGYDDEKINKLIYYLEMTNYIEKIKNITQQELDNTPLDVLQFMMETLNKEKELENEEFKNFQVLLEKDLNTKIDKDLIIPNEGEYDYKRPPGFETEQY